MKYCRRLLSMMLAVLFCLLCFAEPVSAIPSREGFFTGPDETVRVILRLEGEPAAACSEVRSVAEARLTAQHSSFRRALKAAGLTWEENFEYRTLLNGFALTVPRSEISALADLKGVRSVHVANRYDPPEAAKMDSSNEMTNAAWMHESEYTGSGTVIAILDTGITPGHESFGVYDGMLGQAKLNLTQAQDKIASLGYGTFLSEKIPFAYDYYDQDNDANDDVSGHGTHVAGIAAGFACSEDGAIRFCGTAPDAQILAMKIFSSEGDGGTDSSVYFKALEDAYILGADVINLSIGAQNGFSRDLELEDEIFGDIYQTLRDNGVAVSVAAGNESSMADGASNWAGPGYLTSDYADYGTLNSPASYGGNLAAASAENAAYPVHVLRAGERQIVFCDSDDQFFDALYQAGEPPIEYTVVPGHGEPKDYAELLIEGRIALVSRGSNTFQEKVHAAAEAGAAGLLVYNNEPGEIYMYIYDYEIPAAAITKEDGEYLISLSETVTPPPQPEPADDSGEDLGTVYCRVNDQADCVDGGGYLIVSEHAGLVFNAGASNVNASGNGVPVSIKAGYFEATETLRAAELRMEAECLTNDRGYLNCGGTVNEVLFSDSPEDMEIGIFADGTAEIVCNDCSFRYDAAGSIFRFYLPDHPLIGDDDAAVSLYKLGEMPPYGPTQIGILFLPEELVTIENPNGWQPSAFSSMGVTPELELKPSLTGIGGNVRSALFGTEDGYAVWSGTSMAAPNVSGGIACLLQYLNDERPELDPVGRLELAETLLMSTAKVLTDDEGRFVSPRKQGAGLIDLRAAAEAKAVISEPVISLGENDMGTFHICFEVRSLSEDTLTYTVDLTVLRDLCKAFDLNEDGNAEGIYNALRSRNVSRQMVLLGDQTVVVPAGETVSLDLIIAPKDELLEELWADFPNGGWLDGFISLSQPVEKCSGGETCPGAVFEDMPSPRNWAHPGIDFALNHNLFSGTSATTFSPAVTMTRGMMVTVLYAMAGKPEPEGENPFTDVKPGKWYEKPVTWASENGIVSGVDEGLFNPEGEITREQMALIMYRYAEYAGIDTDIAASIDDYPDVGRVHSYAVTAMRWAVGVGILSGTKVDDDVLLDPRNNATRAQVATMFMSFVLNCLEPPAKSSELHLSFTGFVGDWTAAPILEQHDWREIVDLQDGLASADFEVNTNVNQAWAVCENLLTDGNGAAVWLGDNPFANTDFSADHAAISHNGLLNAVWIEPMLLRNARHMIMTVTDAQSGELYAVDDTEYLPKAYWDAEQGAWLSSGLFLYDGTDLFGEPLPGGAKVDVCFYANLAYGEDELGDIAYEDLFTQGSEWMVWDFSLTIDDAAPTIINLRWEPLEKKMSFTLCDDQYLSMSELTPMPEISEDEEVWYDPIWTESYSDADPGSSQNITVPDVSYGEYTLTILDYAGNKSTVRLSLSSSANLEQINFICPEGCSANATDMWYISRAGWLTIPDLTGEPEDGEFVGWLPEPLEGDWTLEDLEDAAMYEEILWPRTKVQIWGDTYYALFRDGDLYFTVQD